jgi:hypothetical protein
MRKVLVGLLVALVIGAGGYFGATYWAERIATRQVDAELDRWRSEVGPATRGSVAFDLWTRTLKVADVALALQGSPDDKISIANVVAVGVDTSGGARRVDLVGLEVSGALPGMPGARLQQRSPQVTLTGYAARPLAPRKAASALDAMRVWLEQFSAITADSIAIPSLTVTVTPAGGAGAQNAPGAAEYTYTNLMLRNVAEGRVAEVEVDGTLLRSNTGQGELTAEVGRMSMLDADVRPLLAFLDPSRPREEDYQRVYRRLSAGPYILRLGDGSGLRIERLVAEDAGLRPSKLSLDDLIFLAEVSNPAGRPPTLTQASMIVDKLAGLYEGVHLGKLEMRGLRFDLRQDAIKIGGIAIDTLDNGRLAEFTLEGLEGQSPAKAPLNIGGITLTGFNVVKFLRTTAQMAVPGTPQPPDQVLRILEALEGMELRDFAVPDPQTGRMVHVDAVNASWGQFVDGVPSRARIAAKLSAPVDAATPEPFKSLASRGIPAVKASIDVGSSWSEAAQTLTVAPASVEIDNLFSVSLKASAGNVPRAMLSIDPARAMAAAAGAEAGPIELSLRDLGANELLAADLGRTRGGGPEMGRVMLAETLSQQGEALSQANPELRVFFQALGQFLQASGETLTVTLTPKGRVGVLELVDAARRDPVAALLASFTVEARTGK